MVKRVFFLSLCFSVLMISCKKDVAIEPVAPPGTAGQPVTPGPDAAHVLTFSFSALANNTPFVPNTAWYTNTSQDHFTVTKFNYYLSNVKLRREDGFVYAEPESYHLIRHVESKTVFSLTGLPEGNYDHIEFLIGVDSLRNISGAQTGDLSADSLMFWDWEQGYIFFKLEGNYISAKVPKDGEYAIHIGGFAGPYKCLQQCSFNLSTPITVKKNARSVVSYNVLIDEIFESPVTIGFDSYFSSVSDATFRSVSQNYKDMFVVAKIEN
jgi:hypothetical protein